MKENKHRKILLNKEEKDRFSVNYESKIYRVIIDSSNGFIDRE